MLTSIKDHVCFMKRFSQTIMQEEMSKLIQGIIQVNDQIRTPNLEQKMSCIELNPNPIDNSSQQSDLI